MKYDILLKDIDYLRPDMTVAKGCTIAILDGKIAGIFDPGGTEENCAKPEADTVITGSRLFAMPGITDAHIHTSQQLLRGRLLDEKPVIWKRVNVPFESRLTEESSALSASLAALEMIRCGTTSFVDAGGKYPEVFAEVYEQAGMRGRLSVFTNDNPYAPETLRAASPEAGVARQRKLKQFLDGRQNGMLRPIYSVTVPTAVSEEMYREMLAAAAEDGVPFETHMNEYSSEVSELLERYGERPFVWLAKEGLIPPEMLAVHSLHLTPEEMEIVAARKIKVAHCPFSNSGKGVPKTPDMLPRGISCGFGSDGAGHGGLDIFREIRLFRCLMNAVRGLENADPNVMPAETLLWMATQGGAAALFMEDQKPGRIKEGAAADIIVLDMDAPHLWPTQNILHTIVESATGQDVRHSVIGGRLVMKDREMLTLDQERIRADAEAAFQKEPFLNHWV
ncbi:MAG: amidohydrolase family protein [Lachnospiraceae bacterium]|nr:amidohydrolase family protein [Lachnospiraceae bacterium]